MAFRRVILSGPKVKEVESDLKRFLDLSKTKIDFPGLKVDIKQGIKPDTLVVDINGDGADSFSKKVKDAGIKFQVQVAIKTEKPMDKKDLKEVIKKVLKEQKFTDAPEIKIIASSILDNQLSDEPYNLRNEEQVNYLAEEIWSALQKED